MSGPTIAPYFPFRRIKITGQSVALAARVARIQAALDKRFQPVCHLCGKKAAAVSTLARLRFHSRSFEIFNDKYNKQSDHQTAKTCNGENQSLWGLYGIF